MNYTKKLKEIRKEMLDSYLDKIELSSNRLDSYDSSIYNRGAWDTFDVLTEILNSKIVEGEDDNE